MEQDRSSQTSSKSEDIGEKWIENVKVEWKLENLDWVLALRRYIHKHTLFSLAFEVGTIIIICVSQMEVLDRLPKATQLG